MAEDNFSEIHVRDIDLRDVQSLYECTECGGFEDEGCHVNTRAFITRDF